MLTQVDIGAAAHFKTKPLLLGAICSQLLSCICMCADLSWINYTMYCNVLH